MNLPTNNTFIATAGNKGSFFIDSGMATSFDVATPTIKVRNRSGKKREKRNRSIQALSYIPLMVKAKTLRSKSTWQPKISPARKLLQKWSFLLSWLRYPEDERPNPLTQLRIQAMNSEKNLLQMKCTFASVPKRRLALDVDQPLLTTPDPDIKWTSYEYFPLVRPKLPLPPNQFVSWRKAGVKGSTSVFFCHTHQPKRKYHCFHKSGHCLSEQARHLCQCH